MNNRRTPLLTPRQREVRAAIREFMHLKGYAPTLREIAAILGIARNAVTKHVDRIIAKGYLGRRPQRYRNLELRLPLQKGAP